jgi:hypothetical protein
MAALKQSRPSQWEETSPGGLVLTSIGTVLRAEQRVMTPSVTPKGEAFRNPAPCCAAPSALRRAWT